MHHIEFLKEMSWSYHQIIQICYNPFFKQVKWSPVLRDQTCPAVVAVFQQILHNCLCRMNVSSSRARILTCSSYQSVNERVSLDIQSLTIVFLATGKNILFYLPLWLFLAASASSVLHPEHGSKIMEAYLILFFLNHSVLLNLGLFILEIQKDKATPNWSDHLSASATLLLQLLSQLYLPMSLT